LQLFSLNYIHPAILQGLLFSKNIEENILFFLRPVKPPALFFDRPAGDILNYFLACGNAKPDLSRNILKLKEELLMQLKPGERSVLAYFPSSGSAQKAALELKEMGYNTVQVDRISRYGVNTDEELNNPGAGGAGTMTGLTLFSSETGDLRRSEGILLGSDPSVSGYGNIDYGVAGGRAFLVTVVTGEGNVDQVTGVLEKHGGRI
jgi:rhodanese-related sulfurtransferase